LLGAFCGGGRGRQRGFLGARGCGSCQGSAPSSAAWHGALPCLPPCLPSRPPPRCRQAQHGLTWGVSCWRWGCMPARPKGQALSPNRSPRPRLRRRAVHAGYASAAAHALVAPAARQASLERKAAADGQCTVTGHRAVAAPAPPPTCQAVRVVCLALGCWWGLYGCGHCWEGACVCVNARLGRRGRGGAWGGGIESPHWGAQ
jgi:hypothetical protein